MEYAFMSEYVEACTGNTRHLDVSKLALAEVYEELKRTDDVSNFISGMIDKMGASQNNVVKASGTVNWQWADIVEPILWDDLGNDPEEKDGDENVAFNNSIDTLEIDLEYMGWGAALQNNEMYRDTLRCRAAQFAQSHGKDSNLMNMPADILACIIDHFRSFYFPSVIGHYYDGKEENRVADVGSLRRVCRALHQLASPLLCTTLNISMENASLDHAFRLIANPVLAQGVHRIKLRLAYRPSAIAESLEQFARIKLRALDNVVANEYMWEEPTEAFTRAGDVLQTMHEDWTRLGSSEKEDGRDGQKILHDGFKSYCEKYEASRHLMVDGQFARTVAKLASMIPRPLAFVTEHDAPTTRPWKGKVDDAILNEPELVSQFLAETDDWELIAQCSPGEALLPLHTVLALPGMLLSEGAAPIRELVVDCLPSKMEWENLREEGGQGSDDWRTEGQF